MILAKSGNEVKADNVARPFVQYYFVEHLTYEITIH